MDPPPTAASSSAASSSSSQATTRPPPNNPTASGASTDSPRFACTLCNRSFGRQEHLRRHNLVHVKQRTFNCTQCSKKFFRRDTLQRHQATHQHTEPNLLRKGARACQNCQVAKARCSGSLPCARCEQRSLPCQVLDPTPHKSSEPPLPRSLHPQYEHPLHTDSRTAVADWAPDPPPGRHPVSASREDTYRSDHSRNSSIKSDSGVAENRGSERPLMRIRTHTSQSATLPHWDTMSPNVMDQRSYGDPHSMGRNLYADQQTDPALETMSYPSNSEIPGRPVTGFRRSVTADNLPHYHEIGGSHVSDAVSAHNLPTMEQAVVARHRSSFHTDHRPSFHSDHRPSFPHEVPTYNKSPEMALSADVNGHARHSPLTQVTSMVRTDIFSPQDNSGMIMHPPAPPIYDVDGWGSNPMTSTINWLADTTSDFDTAIAPLPMSESVYLNNLSHFVFPLITNPFGSPGDHLDGMPLDGLPHNFWSERDRRYIPPPSDNASESIRSDDTRGKSGSSGQFYVDNESGCLPRTKRRKIQGKPPSDSRPLNNVQYNLRAPSIRSPDKIGKFAIPDRIFDRIYQTCQAVIAAVNIPFTPFASTNFPSKDEFESLIALYFKFFSPQLPMLHAPTFPGPDPHWLLVLAIAAAGSHYVEGDAAEIFSVSMHEVLRRILIVAEEDLSCWPADEMTRSQIKIIHGIGLLYSGDERLFRFGARYQQDLERFCQERWQFGTDDVQLNESESIDAQHRTWINSEMRNRTGYCIWLLETMSVFHFSMRPCATLEYATVTMPCNEKLWAAENAHEWKRLMAQFPRPTSLQGVLQDLYVGKHLSPELSEFSRILLIHGIYQRTWEVGGYFKQVLSRYEPSSRKESTHDLDLRSVWLPSQPTYARWRNSALDALDVIHWSANAHYMACNGVEHPTIIHLHLSRIVILAPWQDMINLARFSIEASTLISQSQMLASEQAVRKWATQDQYRARLAVSHAGMLWWHVRRFSVNAYYEPVSVALATLVLWAFPTFRKKPLVSSDHGHPNPTSGNPHSKDKPEDTPGDQSDSEDPGDCDIILLDRPTDDELKRDFVRRGNHMVPNLAGVGNLYGEKAPELVLQEGIKILHGLSCWGVRRQWLVIFEGLLEVIRRAQR